MEKFMHQVMMKLTTTIIQVAHYIVISCDKVLQLITNHGCLSITT
jgi:hypothetical protein